MKLVNEWNTVRKHEEAIFSFSTDLNIILNKTELLQYIQGEQKVNLLEYFEYNWNKKLSYD